ncbi:MAG: MoxR family ATPase [Gammaproteobacteria bacterium]|jgi:MoxR-like ATPase|nr:MoxR family ATPase [Gammaproteobacteria bacterium]MBT3696284.1 MoxR family ATPase [Gammaproteobacteria bacterium]MBT5681407.1 MoxR family ATPase [Gammaproteobacteria bacterium]MBT6025156.1 MoxR family ATPase [Gammaproteobacteria bacterium]MBT6559078.1 MoxR family ATPase [Gammaproteobacteria bacterium]
MNTADSQSPFAAINQARSYLASKVIGQEGLIDRLIMALLCGGHLLVEGAPGLAKTRIIKELAGIIEGNFQRIQFTPDLLPSDVTGTEIYRPEDGTFNFQPGPIFHNLILTDEINRAPAKVQSALLEAMGERQVSFGRETFALPELFMVMATQNPIEQEGTYPLPEAQLDRFLLHVLVDYPDREAETKILQLVRNENAQVSAPAQTLITQHNIFSARQEMLALHMAEPVERYIVELILATRNPPERIKPWLEFGASPRGTIGLDMCARALAWLNDRNFVTPEDVQSVAHDVLRHRLILSFDADAQGITTDQVIDDLIALVPVP